MTKASRFVLFCTALFVAITLANPVQAAAANANSEAVLTLATPLTESQKDELEQIVDDRLERSAAVSDRVQSVINENFGLLFAISGLTISALCAIPVFSGAMIFIFRKAILASVRNAIADQLVNHKMQQILEEEVNRQLSAHVEAELSKTIRQRLTELEEQAVGDLSTFKTQLDRFVTEIEKDKQTYVVRLTELDPDILRDTISKVVAKVVADKFSDLKFKPPLPFIGRR